MKKTLIRGVILGLFLITILSLLPIVMGQDHNLWAGEKEELQWKARALIAEANLYQSKLSEAQKTIQDFVKELDAKGYMADRDGNIIEKPKPPVKPVEPEKKDKK